MNRRRLEELAERVAALEAAAGPSDAATLDARLAAIEDAVRRLRYGDEDLGEIDDAARRCRELVSKHVPAGERVAIATDGDPGQLALYERPVARFPQPTPGGPDLPLDHGAAAIAHLEAQRATGIRFLLLPESGGGPMERYAELVEHLLSRYEVLADAPGAGLLVDVSRRRPATLPQRTLAEALDRLAGGDRFAPVLDWTDLELSASMVDHNVFTAPGEVDGELPYLDHTIDVVIVQDPTQLLEGRRVASDAVVSVSQDETGRVVVTHVEGVRGDTPTPAPIVLAVATSDPEDPWLSRVEEAVAERPAITVVASPDPWAAAAEADTAVAVVAERGVLPLPGCVEALASTLEADERVGAVAVKLFAADGSLGAAGTTVFADGSLEGVAAGSRQVAAPWHEYVRPVCAATGLVGVRSSAVRHASTASGSLVDMAAGLWQAGLEVRYQPDACAVRTLDADQGLSSDEVASAGWAEALPARPDRPVPLDTAAWRRLIARDDPGECWR